VANHPKDPHQDPSQDLFPSHQGQDNRQLAIARNHAISVDTRLGDPVAETQDNIDLLSYWHIIIKRRWMVLGVLAIIFITSLVGTLLTTPIYRATAVLQIERQSVQVLETQGVMPTEDIYADDFYQTQYELLKSRALAQRVVSQLGLVESGELQRMQPGSPWQKIMGLFGHEEKSEQSTPLQTTKQSDAEKAEKVNQLAGSFAGGVGIEPVRNSRLVRINYDSPDPAFAQKAANAIAESFIASNLERKFDSSAYAKGYLEDRLKELKLKLEDSERKLVEFAQKEQIIGTSGGENAGTLTQQSLQSLNAAYNKAQEDRIRAEARWEQAQASSGISLAMESGNSSFITTLQESRGKLMVEYQDKLKLYKPAYPIMLQLKGQIEEIDKQIASEAGNIRGAIQAQYLATVKQESMLAAQIKGLKTDVLDQEGRSIQYTIFKREVDTNRQLYDGLLQRYKEIGIAGGISTNNVSIVDRAQMGGQFKPDLMRNLMLATMAGLLLGCLLALGFEYLDDSLKAPEDIEKQLGLPILGVIPKLKDPQTPTTALQDLRGPFTEAYRSVRTALQFSTDKGVPRVLLITSASPGEGKSTTARALAQNIAELGRRVLIVDCDLRNPSLHRHFNTDNSTGLTNFLAGGMKPMDLIQKTNSPNLSYLSTGPLPPNPAELLMGSKLVSFLTVAVEKFDQIIIDGPPILGLADAPILANRATATLLVIEAGETRVAVAKNAIKRIFAARGHLIGAVMTKYNAKLHSGYGYGAGDYDYYSYGGNDKPKERLTRQ
jgi:polysaccharide biosynthesis transport protein